MSLNESIVEDPALESFEELNYAVGHGPHLALGEPAAGRHSIGAVVLVARLRVALRPLRGAILDVVPEAGSQKILWFPTPSRVLMGRRLHGRLSNLLGEGWSRAGSTDTVEGSV